jgi:hypothetical protein
VGAKRSSEDIYPYLKNHPTGRQLGLIMSLPLTAPVLYLDSDILFFPGANDLHAQAQKRDVPALYLADCRFSGDERLLRDPKETNHPVNTGFLLLFQKLDWSLGVKRFLEMQGPPIFFTNQTITHLAMHANGAAPFDPRKYVLQLDDQFVYPDRYANSSIALRHYVNPVRHKFWTSPVCLNGQAAAHSRCRQCPVGSTTGRRPRLDGANRRMAKSRPSRRQVLPDRCFSQARIVSGPGALRLIGFPQHAARFIRENAGRFDVIDALIVTLPFSKRSLNFQGLLVARSVGLYYLYEKFEQMAAKRWTPESKGKLLGRPFYWFFNRRARSAAEASVRHCDLLNLPNSDELSCVRDEINRPSRRSFSPTAYGRSAPGLWRPRPH